VFSLCHAFLYRESNAGTIILRQTSVSGLIGVTAAMARMRSGGTVSAQTVGPSDWRV